MRAMGGAGMRAIEWAMKAPEAAVRTTQGRNGPRKVQNQSKHMVCQQQLLENIVNTPSR